MTYRLRDTARAKGTLRFTPEFWIICDDDSRHASTWSSYADYLERVGE